ncbi:MAG: DUF4912 domain-containing protein [Candidatus Brocadiia bacterium]
MPQDNTDSERPGAGEDSLGAVVRGPESVYVYWTLEGDRSRTILQQLGEEAEWVLRVLDLSEGTSTGITVEAEDGGHYVEVRPGRSYGFELAARAPGAWRTVCRTQRVHVPAARRTRQTGREPTALERIRPAPQPANVPGLDYESTEPYLASSPHPEPDEEDES